MQYYKVEAFALTQYQLVRSPKEVHSQDVVLVFAQVDGYEDVKLKVTATISASMEPRIPGVDLPSPFSITYELPMLHIASSSQWYATAIPDFQLKRENSNINHP